MVVLGGVNKVGNGYFIFVRFGGNIVGELGVKGGLVDKVDEVNVESGRICVDGILFDFVWVVFV